MNLGKMLMLFKRYADATVEKFYTDFFIDVYFFMKEYENKDAIFQQEVEYPVAMIFRTNGTNKLEISPEGNIDILDRRNNAYLSQYSDIKRIVKVVGEEVEIIEGDKLTELIQSCKNVPEYLLR